MDLRKTVPLSRIAEAEFRKYICPRAEFTSELRVRLAPLNRFKPSSKIFYWPFQGGTFFVDLFMFLFCLVFAMFCARLFICASWSPAGKRLTSWLSFVVSSVSLSLSHWYPGSGVVLDCIDSWSLQPYLLCRSGTSGTYSTRAELQNCRTLGRHNIP